MNGSWPYNFTIRQGSTFRESFQLLDGEAADTASKAIDLNGCQGRMQIRRTVEAAIPLLSFTSEDGGLRSKSRRAPSR